MAGVWLLPTLVIIFGTIFTIVAIFIAVRLNHSTQKIDVTPNAPLIDCSMRRQFTDGYSMGIIKKEIPRKNGCVYVEFYPFDHEQGEDKPRPAVQSLVVAKQFIKRLSRGDLSSRREIVKILSRDPSDIPEKMRGTDEGKWITKEGQLAHLEKTFGKAIPAGDEAIYEQMINWSRGNISRATMAQIREENQELRKLFISHNQEQKEGGTKA